VNDAHLDLFSGIGGFALAARWAGFNTVAFSEIDKYASKVLKRHWPQVPNLGDIRSIRGEEFSGVSLLTGGFPCQPYSLAGERRGKDDDRALWPEMLRVISEARPHWIVGENVAGFIDMGLESCISDLEGIGYTVAPPFVIPALAVNARHRRDRVWIVANSDNNRKSTFSINGEMADMQKASRADGYHSECFLFQGGETPSAEGRKESRAEQLSRPVFTNAWDALSAARVWRVDNGVSSRMDTHRNRGIGNAIVPENAYQILKTIKEISNGLA